MMYRINRPISILLIFFKKTGKVNVQQVNIFCNKNIISVEVQNSFREKKSTTTATWSFTEKGHT